MLRSRNWITLFFDFYRKAISPTGEYTWMGATIPDRNASILNMTDISAVPIDRF